jgi:hypothetical protein
VAVHDEAPTIAGVEVAHPRALPRHEAPTAAVVVVAGELAARVSERRVAARLQQVGVAEEHRRFVKYRPVAVSQTRTEVMSTRSPRSEGERMKRRRKRSFTHARRRRGTDLMTARGSWVRYCACKAIDGSRSDGVLLLGKGFE